MNQDRQLDRQVEQLVAVYAERSDSELLQLYAQRGDLTDAAQHALQQVIRERKLTLPEPAAAHQDESHDDDHSGALGDEEVCIWTFSDAFQASEALRNLSAAQIEHSVVDWNAQAQNHDAPRPAVNIGIVVHQGDAQSAKTVLQQTMGLFPERDADDPFEDPFAEFAGLLQVGLFQRDDALLVARALGEAGVSYVWNDDRDDPSAGSDNVSIEVRGSRLDQAQKIAGSTLAVL